MAKMEDHFLFHRWWHRGSEADEEHERQMFVKHYEEMASASLDPKLVHAATARERVPKPRDPGYKPRQ